MKGRGWGKEGRELFSNNEVNYQGQRVDLHTLPDFIQNHPSLCWHPGRRPHWFCGHHLCAWHSLYSSPYSSSIAASIEPTAVLPDPLGLLVRGPQLSPISSVPTPYFPLAVPAFLLILRLPVPCCQGESVPALISICSQHITQI